MEHYLGDEQGPSTDTVAVEALLKEVQAFRLVNHLYWGLWGVNQASTEGCDGFDFMVYGTHRIRQYYKSKKETEQQSI